ncbi:ABC-2 type transport system permease protein [Methanolobus vulcani]|jgi:ABC-2 type transport system permease protein|uniref:ABC-2 type transport system permease protein n=1 Tax=Methanolobus vulcani TaxID=38026 RepID=A0A7Z7FF54_9EURY|nr:ABC transporter permease subunit [Methanolobus vulcani]SDG11639.1 ABC-2 type transport system permease protein [Methanolobus vulcani]
MNNMLTIAKKEFQDIFRSRTFSIILVLLLVLTATSILVSTLVFKSQVSQYESSLALLLSMGKTPTEAAPQLYPLNLLRGVVDYIEIIGAIIGILLGYLSIAKEKNTRTMKLLLSKPITKKDIVFGKITGNFLFVSLTIVFVAAMILASFLAIGGISLTAVDYYKILAVVILSIAYIMVFFTLSFFLSIQQKSLSNALMICFTIWLVFVLVLPQIGDTMDPDNQVPGGFFKSMGFDKPQEKAVMAKFSGYENTRDFIEQLSVTKHYERAGFAIFGVKTKYNDMPFPDILADQWFNIVSVFGLLAAGIFADAFIMYRNREAWSV